MPSDLVPDLDPDEETIGDTRLPVRTSVSVVVPAYNEALILMRSLVRLYEYMQEEITPQHDWEVVIVNDGSTDETGEIADAFAARRDHVRVLHHRSNFNMGQALRYAFGTCAGDYVVTIDCDLSYAPDHIGRMLEAIEATKARVVVASPYAKGGSIKNVPLTRLVLSKLANRFLSISVRGELSTLTSMVRAYDRRFLFTLNLKAMDIEINSEILYKARVLRAKIVEIPAILDWGKPDAAGQLRISSTRTVRSTAAYVFSGFLFRPLLVFLLPGSLLIAIGALAFAGTGLLVALHRGGWFEHPVLLAGSGFATVLGVQLAALGILAVQAKRYFEEMFHLGTSILRTTKVDHRRDPLAP